MSFKSNMEQTINPFDLSLPLLKGSLKISSKDLVTFAEDTYGHYISYKVPEAKNKVLLRLQDEYLKANNNVKKALKDKNKRIYKKTKKLNEFKQKAKTNEYIKKNVPINKRAVKDIHSKTKEKITYGKFDGSIINRKKVEKTNIYVTDYAYDFPNVTLEEIKAETDRLKSLGISDRAIKEVDEFIEREREREERIKQWNPNFGEGRVLTTREEMYQDYQNMYNIVEIDNCMINEYCRRIERHLNNPLFFGNNDTMKNNKKISVKIETNNGVISTKYIGSKLELMKNVRSIITKSIQIYSDTIFESMIISVFTPKFKSSIGGASNDKSYIKAKEQWFVYNIPSHNNCLFIAFTLARNPEKFFEQGRNVPQLINRSKKLKVDCRENGYDIKKLYSSKSDVEAIVNKTKTPIVMHKSNFDVDYELYPQDNVKDKRTKPREPIHIICKNNHYMAMLDRSKYKELESSKDLIQQEEEPTKPDEDFLIKKRIFESKFDTKYASWDIEATIDNGCFKSYAVGMAYSVSDDDEPIYTSFWGLDCLKDFIKFLFNEMETFDGYTFYAHNGGKFDTMLLFRECMGVIPEFQIVPKSCIEQNGRYISFQLTDGNHKIKFLDSLCMFAGQSLDDITNAMKVKHRKLVDVINHDDVTLDNYNTFTELPRYLEHDVLGLLECIQLFSENVFKATGINISQCVTSASFSKRTYRKNYCYDPKTGKMKHFVYYLEKEKDKFIRQTYYGGRNEVFVHNKHIEKPLFYYDFTSLYPSVGTKNLPSGKPNWCHMSNDYFKNFFGFCEVYVKSIRFDKKPLHARYENNKLLFKHFDTPVKMVLFSEEIRLGMKSGIYEYNFEDCRGISFYNKSPFLKEFFEDCFRNKAQAKAEGNDVMELVYKIIANAGYGFWGLRYADREVIITTPSNSDQLQMYFEQEKLVNFAEFGDHYSLKVVDDLPMKDFNVSIASAITSYARMELWSCINDIETKGYDVYYCDTDSIITDCKLSDHSDLMDRYCWDGVGDALGSLKNECLAKIIKANKKSDNPVDITKQLELDGGEICFDEFIGLGCKFYGVRKTCYNGEVIEIVKCKGYNNRDRIDKITKELISKKLTFDDFVNITNGKKTHIEQTQIQFSIPKSNLLCETNKFKVCKKEVPKAFKPTYNKGTIDLITGKVIPFLN